MTRLKLFFYRLLGRSPLIDMNELLIKHNLMLELANKRLKEENKELMELLNACQDDGR